MLEPSGEKGRARRVRHAVTVVSNREARGGVEQTQFGEFVDGPGGLAPDAEGRRAVAHDGLPSHLFQRVLARAYILAEGGEVRVGSQLWRPTWCPASWIARTNLGEWRAISPTMKKVARMSRSPSRSSSQRVEGSSRLA